MERPGGVRSRLRPVWRPKHDGPTAANFFSLWLANLRAASFVFLMGTSLASSVERHVAKGVTAYEIDKGILIRGLIIALLDLTTS